MTTTPPICACCKKPLKKRPVEFRAFKREEVTTREEAARQSNRELLSVKWFHTEAEMRGRPDRHGYVADERPTSNWIRSAHYWDGESWGLDNRFCTKECGYRFGVDAIDMIKAGKLVLAKAPKP